MLTTSENVEQLEMYPLQYPLSCTADHEKYTIFGTFNTIICRFTQSLRQETTISTHRSWRSVSSGQSFVRGEEIWLAPCRGSLQMKIRQIFRSISDPGAFIIQQVTWRGELKFQYIGSDLYAQIKWLEICNLTSLDFLESAQNRCQSASTPSSAQIPCLQRVLHWGLNSTCKERWDISAGLFF